MKEGIFLSPEQIGFALLYIGVFIVIGKRRGTCHYLIGSSFIHVRALSLFNIFRDYDRPWAHCRTFLFREKVEKI